MRAKIYILFTLLLVVSAGREAAAQKNKSALKYIDKYTHLAVNNMKEFGVPASITMAQGMLESGFGEGTLARKSNNHFGIKCKSHWNGKKVYHDDDEKGECFRAYSSVEDSYIDHGVFLSESPRYASLFELAKDDYKGWAKGLKKAGYATNPKYAESLIRVIELYELSKLDKINPRKLRREQRAKERALKIAEEAELLPVIERSVSTEPIYVMNGLRVYAKGRNRFIYAHSGYTVDMISQRLNMSKSKLARYNDGKRSFSEGELIYIAKKRD